VKKNGQRLIHSNAMGGMTYLSDDIGRNQQLMSAGAGVGAPGLRRRSALVHPSLARSAGLAKLSAFNRRSRP
jgi:hypothetical protein